MIGKNEVLYPGSTKRMRIAALDVPPGTDPTALPVEVTFIEPSRADEPEVWHPAEWMIRDGIPFVTVVVGALGPITLDPGDYVVRWRVDGAEERPVQEAPNRLIQR